MTKNTLENAKRVAAHCPRCGKKYSPPIQWVNNQWGIDDVKCSDCFNNGFLVNLVRDVPEPVLETDVRQTEGEPEKG